MKVKDATAIILFIALILSLAWGFFMVWDLLREFTQTTTWDILRPHMELMRNFWLISLIVQIAAIIGLGILFFQKKEG